MAKPELEKAWFDRYERWASLHEQEYRIAGWSATGLSRRLALVLHQLRGLELEPKSLVLDLGAGPGTYTRAITKIGHRCLGLDYSKKVIDAARKRGEGETYLQGEAYHLPFRRDVFSVVVCVGVLQSLQRPIAALEEINRVLIPGGHLLLDGLNRLFWAHQLRTWREKRAHHQERMRAYDPFALIQDTQILGFDQSRLHWLAVPASLQAWLNRAQKETGPFAARLFGHAFLLHARKVKEPEKGHPVC
jgi:SAM-dependent methyltransferase